MNSPSFQAQVSCPHCGLAMTITQAHCGRQFLCPQCQTRVQVAADGSSAFRADHASPPVRRPAESARPAAARPASPRTAATGKPWPMIAAAVAAGSFFVLPYFHVSAVGRTSSNMPIGEMSGDLGSSFVWGWNIWWGWLALLLAAVTLGAGFLRRRRPDLQAQAATAQAAGFAALTGLVLLGILIGFWGVALSMYVPELHGRVPVSGLTDEMTRAAQQVPGAGFVQMLGGQMRHEADLTIIPLGAVVLLAAAGFGLYLTAPVLLRRGSQAATEASPAAGQAAAAAAPAASRAPRAAFSGKIDPKIAKLAATGLAVLVVVILGGMFLFGGPSGPAWLAGTFYAESGERVVIDVGGCAIHIYDSSGEDMVSEILSVSYPKPDVAEMDVRGDLRGRMRIIRTADGVQTESLSSSGQWRHEATLRRR